jgi:TusA-related sulfurtransferase/rhodanese-related sulfurtransferase
MTIKLLFNEEGKILGAQAIGYDGVDKRIDVIAATIRLGGTVSDLTELELSYAPPFSSTKDPVNMAGFVAENVITGKMDVLTPEEFSNYNKENTILLDVRTEIEFNNGHVEGALNIPVDDLRDRLNELDRNKEIIEYCQVGLRGYVASRILSAHGYKVKNITGGYKSMSVLNYISKIIENNTKVQKQELDNETQTVKSDKKEESLKFDKSIDVCGLNCPGPFVKVKESMDDLKSGEILKVTSSDPGFYDDIKSWCEKSNNLLIDLNKDKGKVTAFIKKQQ